jgi:hypothetical protein
VPGCFGFVFLCFRGICVLKVYDGRDAGGVAPAFVGVWISSRGQFETGIRPFPYILHLVIYSKKK